MMRASEEKQITWGGLCVIDQAIRIFRDKLGMDNPTSVPLNDTIRGPELHAYVRALGFWKRYTEIGDLLSHLGDSGFVMDERFTAKTIVAAKVFLDGVILDGGVRDGPELVEEREVVLQRLESVVEMLGGWPDESECEIYRIVGQLRRETRGNFEWQAAA
jgi:hypothetical protein